MKPQNRNVWGLPSVDPSLQGDILLIGGQLTITDDVMIKGPGAGRITLFGESDRVFEINVDVAVDLSGLAMTGLRTADLGDVNGGAIRNAGTLTLMDSAISESGAEASGGGIFSRVH